MDVFVSLNGMYSRGETLIQATRDFDRNRISLEALEAAYEADYAALRELQGDAPLVSDGLLNWQDLARPFAHLTGADPGPLTRSFETNTFYRVLHFPKAVTWGRLDEWAARYFRFGTMAFLPSPYTFTRMATGLSLEDATALLRDVVAHLVPRGFHTFSFQEPFAVYEGNAQALAALKPALETLREVAPDARFVLTFYFGDAAPLLSVAWDLPVDAVGVDLTHTDVAALDVPQGRGLMLGIVDTTNSLLETPEVVQEALNLARSKRPQFLILSGSADFFFLPRDVADAKYRFLKQIANSG